MERIVVLVLCAVCCFRFSHFLSLYREWYFAVPFYGSDQPLLSLSLSLPLPNELADLLVMPGDIPWVRQDGNTRQADTLSTGAFCALRYLLIQHLFSKKRMTLSCLPTNSHSQKLSLSAQVFQ